MSEDHIHFEYWYVMVELNNQQNDKQELEATCYKSRIATLNKSIAYLTMQLQIYKKRNMYDELFAMHQRISAKRERLYFCT